MTRSLPTAPNLEHLKKQAKDLRKAYRTRDPKCCATLRLLRRFANFADREIFESELSLNEAQMALALDYGFKSWADLKKHVLGRTDNLKFLHIHCGDSSAQSLRNSSVSGDVQVWREIYIEGPVPDSEPSEKFCVARAKFLSTSMNLDYDSVLKNTRDMYHRMLPKAGKYEEVILWFDSCMFDQTIMIHLIDQCAKQQWPNTKLSLNGLNRTQKQILQVISEGKSKLKPIFAAATGDVEERPFMGDTSCWDIINGLASCKEPLVKIDGPGSFKDFLEPDEIGTPTLKDIKRWDVSITDTGKEVLTGKQDFIKLNGIDTWLGGTHLQGPKSQWRWDESNRKLVKTSDAKTTDLSVNETVHKKPAENRNTRIMYVELKTHPNGRGDRGPAHIGRVKFSKSGRTIYYRGKKLQRTKGPVGYGHYSNFVDIETGDQYWVSGPKKDGKDRHYALSTPILIDENVREEYWTDIRKQPENVNKKTT